MANNYLQFKSVLEGFGCEVKADEPMKNHTSPRRCDIILSEDYSR